MRDHKESPQKMVSQKGLPYLVDNYSELQLRWKIIFPFLAKSRAYFVWECMRMGTRLCKEWENNFPTQLQFTVGTKSFGVTS